MSNKAQKICALTGHRPAQILGNESEQSHAFQALKTTVETVIRHAVDEGFSIFRSGGAMGFDLWAAEAVLRLKAEHPHIQLRFILPCETQADDWPEGWRERYFDLLSQADAVTYVQTKYTGDCMLRRNRALIDGAHWVIAYYDGSKTDDTAYTVRYAAEKGVPVRNMHHASDMKALRGGSEGPEPFRINSYRPAMPGGRGVFRSVAEESIPTFVRASARFQPTE